MPIAKPLICLLIFLAGASVADLVGPTPENSAQDACLNEAAQKLHVYLHEFSYSEPKPAVSPTIRNACTNLGSTCCSRELFKDYKARQLEIIGLEIQKLEELRKLAFRLVQNKGFLVKLIDSTDDDKLMPKSWSNSKDEITDGSLSIKSQFGSFIDNLLGDVEYCIRRYRAVHANDACAVCDSRFSNIMLRLKEEPKLVFNLLTEEHFVERLKLLGAMSDLLYYAVSISLIVGHHLNSNGLLKYSLYSDLQLVHVHYLYWESMSLRRCMLRNFQTEVHYRDCKKFFKEVFDVVRLNGAKDMIGDTIMFLGWAISIWDGLGEDKIDNFDQFKEYKEDEFKEYLENKSETVADQSYARRLDVLKNFSPFEKSGVRDDAEKAAVREPATLDKATQTRILI